MTRRSTIQPQVAAAGREPNSNFLDQNRNSQFFANARRAAGREPESADLQDNGMARTPLSNLDDARLAGNTNTRADRATATNPRGLLGGEYARNGRRRIAGVTREQAEATMDKWRHSNDAFFADADRTRHMDPSRPHKTERAYRAGQAANRGVLPSEVTPDNDPVLALQKGAQDAAKPAQPAGVGIKEARAAQLASMGKEDWSARARALSGKTSDGRLNFSKPEAAEAMDKTFGAIENEVKNKRRQQLNAARA